MCVYQMLYVWQSINGMWFLLYAQICKNSASTKRTRSTRPRLSSLAAHPSAWPPQAQADPKLDRAMDLMDVPLVLMALQLISPQYSQGVDLVLLALVGALPTKTQP